MAEKRNRTSGRDSVQTVTAASNWKGRLTSARALVAKDWGQQDVMIEVVKILPSIDSLLNKTRWHNAWTKRTADPELTVAIEEAAKILVQRKNSTRKRLGRQPMRPPSDL